MYIGSINISDAYIGTTRVKRVYSGEHKIYPDDDYLTFTAQENCTFKFSGSSTSNTLEYSLNSGSTWVSLANNTNTPQVQSGKTIMWRGKTGMTITSDSGIGRFLSGGKYEASGNIMCLIDPDNYVFNKKLTNNYVFKRLFLDSTGLTKANSLVLQAETLSVGCYNEMFKGCTSLTVPPELPSTTLAGECYSGMMAYCYSLTTAPELPAINMAQQCYRYMLAYCTSLTEAPELPSNNLAYMCYQGMFRGCSRLTTGPVLNTEVMQPWCYGAMFMDCGALVNPPALPSMMLDEACYRFMFSNCVNLTTAPLLPAKEIKFQSYYSMFAGCTKLNSITCLAESGVTTANTENWVSGVASTGTFYKPSSASWTQGVNGVPTGWDTADYNQMKYLTFTAQQNCTFKFSSVTTSNTVQYSLDNGSTWVTIANNTYTPTVNSGNTIMWKASGLTINAQNGIGKFISTGNYEVSGNIMSLCFGDDFRSQTSLYDKNSVFRNLFSGSTGLTKASELCLPATELSQYCYYGLFYNCTYLYSAPKLPAMSIDDYCYSSMFYGCTSLTTAPELPATILYPGCYMSMFSYCSSLVNVPGLKGVYVDNYCCERMFSFCTSLKTGPELPAKTLETNCYTGMFSGCTKLNSIRCLAENKTTGCTANWVAGVASTGTFYKSSSASWTQSVNGVPNGWTIRNA